MRYPVLVLPDTAWLEEETVALLRRYMEQGGHLIAVGPLAAQYFADEAGVNMAHPFTTEERQQLARCLTVEDLDKAAETLPIAVKRYLEFDGFITGLHALSCAVTPLEGTESAGSLYEGNAPKGPCSPAATARQVGKGTCTCIWTNIGAISSRSVPGPRLPRWTGPAGVSSARTGDRIPFRGRESEPERR